MGRQILSMEKKTFPFIAAIVREGYVRFVSDKTKIEELSKVFPEKDYRFAE